MWSGSAARGTLGRRGAASWGKEMDNHTRAEKQDLRRRRGSRGTWGSETKNLYRIERRRERQERRSRSLLFKLLG